MNDNSLCAVSPSNLYELMGDFLGLPKSTKWFELKAYADTAIVIKCEYFLEISPDKLEGLKVSADKYKNEMIEARKEWNKEMKDLVEAEKANKLKKVAKILNEN